LGRRNNAWIKIRGGARGENTGRWGEETDLDRGHLAVEAEDDGHLQHEPEHVVDAVGAKVLEALSVVATLQEEGAPHGRLAEPLLQLSCLPREHQRWQLRQLLLRGLPVAPWLCGSHGPTGVPCDALPLRRERRRLGLAERWL
jgi:hypothetical protein